MRILLSNDDGIGSVGIRALEKAAKMIADDVWVVAPKADRSACSRSISINRTIAVNKIDDKIFEVDGTPSDCVLLALYKLLDTTPPDLILTGINVGSNLACDIGYSGTVAAAVEGMIHGIKSIAFSQSYTDVKFIDWDCAVDNVYKIVKKILTIQDNMQAVFNVNFPSCAPLGARITPHARILPSVKIEQVKDGYIMGGGGSMYLYNLYQALKDKNTDAILQNEGFAKFSFLEKTILKYMAESGYAEYIEDHSDLATISKGYISITPLTVNFNNQKNLHTLEKYF